MYLPTLLTNRFAPMSNCFEDMLFLLHNAVMLNNELKPNVGDLFRTFANLSAPTAGRGAEFCASVQTVLTIGLSQLKKVQVQS